MAAVNRVGVCGKIYQSGTVNRGFYTVVLVATMQKILKIKCDEIE